MGDLLRLVFMVLAFFAVGVATALQEPEWAEAVGVEQLAEAVLVPQEMRPDRERDLAYERQDRAIKQRIDAKDACVRELIAGRITLLEAAAQFRRLDEEYPVATDILCLGSKSRDEQLCRQVIQWTRATLCSCPTTTADDLVERLEQDLRRHKQAEGAIVLPAAY